MTSRPSLRRRRAGFTIIEVLATTALATLVAMELWAVVSSLNAGLSDIRAATNRNAQTDEAMRLLLWGRNTGSGEAIPGLTSFSTTSALASFPQAAGRAYLSNAEKDLEIGTPRTVPINTECHAPSVPLPDCSQSGESITVGGYIYSPPTISASTAILDDEGHLRTRQLAITHYDPVLTGLVSQTGDSSMVTFTRTVRTHAALRITQ